MTNFQSLPAFHPLFVSTEGGRPKFGFRALRNAPCGNCRGRRAQRRRASTLVEFALIVPMLLLLTMGMIQGGIILNAHISLSNLVRDVGRYAAIHGTDVGANADIRNYAVDKGRNLNLTIRPQDVIIGSPANGEPKENTAAQKTNRVKYVTQLPIAIKCDISGRVFLPPNFMGAQMMPGGVLSVDTTVVCE